MKTTTLPTKAFYALALGFLLTSLTTCLMFPGLPAAAKALHVTSASIKRMMSFELIGYLLGQLILPALSEYIGRRPTLLIACFGYGSVALAAGFSNHYALFVIMYVLTGFFAANFTSVNSAILKDTLFGQHLTQSVAKIGIIMSFGYMIGALGGTLIVTHYSWHGILWCLSIYAYLLGITCFLLVPETIQKNHPAHESYFKSLITAVTITQFRKSIVWLSLSFGSLMAILTAMPFVYTHLYHITSVEAGWLILLISIPYTAGAFTNSALLKHISKNKLSNTIITLQWLSVTLLLTCNAIFQMNLWENTAALLVVSFFLGFAIPLAKAGCLATKSNKPGAITSAMKILQTLGAVLLTTIIAHIAAIHFIMLAGVLFCSTTIAIICYYVNSKTNK